MSISFHIDDTDLQSLLDAAAHRAVAEAVASADLLRAGGDRLAYDAKTLARLLSVTPQIVNDERRRGRLRGVRVGKSYRYAHAEVMRYLSRGDDDRGTENGDPADGEPTTAADLLDAIGHRRGGRRRKAGGGT